MHILSSIIVDKEHSRCKYPTWVTKHHDWHSLDGSKTYHFTSGNATLKVSGDMHEERIVCHNQVGIDSSGSSKVKLIAHITSGWWVVEQITTFIYFFLRKSSSLLNMNALKVLWHQWQNEKILISILYNII